MRTASLADGGNAWNGFQSTSSGRIDLKTASPGWWVCMAASLLTRWRVGLIRRRPIVASGATCTRGSADRRPARSRLLVPISVEEPAGAFSEFPGRDHKVLWSMPAGKALLIRTGHV